MNVQWILIVFMGVWMRLRGNKEANTSMWISVVKSYSINVTFSFASMCSYFPDSKLGKLFLWVIAESWESNNASQITPFLPRERLVYGFYCLYNFSILRISIPISINWHLLLLMIIRKWGKIGIEIKSIKQIAK